MLSGDVWRYIADIGGHSLRYRLRCTCRHLRDYLSLPRRVRNIKAYSIVGSSYTQMSNDMKTRIDKLCRSYPVRHNELSVQFITKQQDNFNSRIKEIFPLYTYQYRIIQAFPNGETNVTNVDCGIIKLDYININRFEAYAKYEEKPWATQPVFLSMERLLEHQMVCLKRLFNITCVRGATYYPDRHELHFVISRR